MTWWRTSPLSGRSSRSLRLGEFFQDESVFTGTGTLTYERNSLTTMEFPKMADPSQSDLRPESDIYTMLLIVATIFLVIGTVFVSVRAQDLFGNWMPF